MRYSKLRKSGKTSTKTKNRLGVGGLKGGVVYWLRLGFFLPDGLSAGCLVLSPRTSGADSDPGATDSRGNGSHRCLIPKLPKVAQLAFFKGFAPIRE